MNRAQRLSAYWKQRPAVRATVWERDGRRCRACGTITLWLSWREAQSWDFVAQMHELRPRSLGGSGLDIRNVIALCPQCHHDVSMRLGGRKLTITPLTDKGANGPVRMKWTDGRTCISDVRD